MPELNHFRTFEISQDGSGNAFELSRLDERVVCLAFDARFGCFCEIAALTRPAGQGSTTMEEFLEQASTVAGLHHRGLATLLDYGDDQGVRFYAVEFVDGEVLLEYARRVNGLPLALAFSLCADLADALGAISILGLPIAAGKARVTLDDRGRLRVRIVDYPLGMLHPEGPRDAAAGLFELAHLLEELASGEVIGQKDGGRSAEVGEVAQRLRQLGTIHDAGAMLREAASAGRFIPVEARHRPKLMLAQKLFSQGAPEEFLSDDYRVEQMSSASLDPYSIAVVRLSESRPLRMHVLPPDYILSDDGLPIYESDRSSAVVGAEALWRSEHFRLVSEDRFPGFSLTALLRQAGELSNLEVMLLLDHVETALLEARSAGAELAKVHPDNVLLHFVGLDFDGAETLIKRRPITKWPEFRVVLRAHQTMRGLTTLTPNAKQRFVQVRAALEQGVTVCNLSVLELYLQLHDSGRPEQAEELLDRFEQSCKAAAGAAPGVIEQVVDDEAGGEVDGLPAEVLSPIALSVAAAQVAGGDEEVEVAEEDEAVISPLGGGLLFGREALDQGGEEEMFYVDEFEEDGAMEPVISPIAAALGVVVEDLGEYESDADDAYWSGQQCAEDVEMKEPQVGLGRGLFGGESSGDDLADDDDDDASPFRLNPLPGDEDEGLPELDLDDEDEADDEGGRGILFFLVLVVVAIALAAIGAHVTGKAFWLR